MKKNEKMKIRDRFKRLGLWNKYYVLVPIATFFISILLWYSSNYLTKYYYDINKISNVTTGGLLPANDDTKLILKSIIDSSDILIIKNNDIECFGQKISHKYKIYAGGNLQIFNDFTKNVDVIRIGGKSLVAVKMENEQLYVSLFVYDQNFVEIIKIIDNIFYKNPDYKPVKNPIITKHDLIVYDQFGEEILNVRYNNKKLISFLGVFSVPGHPEVRVTKDEMTPFGMSGNVFYGYAAPIVSLK